MKDPTRKEFLGAIAGVCQGARRDCRLATFGEYLRREVDAWEALQRLVVADWFASLSKAHRDALLEKNSDLVEALRKAERELEEACPS